MSGLPKGWVEAKLGEVTTKIGSGATPTGGEQSYKASGIPLVRSLNIHFDGVRSEGLAFLDDRQAAKLDNVIVEADDVLLNITGASIGRVAVAPNAYAGARVNQHVSIIRLARGVLPRYVRGFLASPVAQEFITRENYGATRQALTKSMIENFAFPLPPLAEQKRIVAKLDALNAKSARARTELARIETLVSRYKQAVLSKAFSGELTREWRSGHPKPGAWKHLPLSQLVSDGPSNGWSPKADGKAGDLKSLKLSATSSGALRLDESTIKYLDQTLPSGSKFWLLADDILIQRANSLELLGTTVLFDGPSREFIFPDLMMRIRADDKKALPPYLATYLNSDPARAYFRANATGTAGNMPKINGSTVRETLVPTAPVEEQREIVRRIETAFAKIDRLAGQAKRALELVGKLDDAILAKAFRGELVPQDETDEPADRLLARIRAEREAAPKARRGRRAKA